MTSPRRFPSPWSVEQTAWAAVSSESFVYYDVDGQRLASTTISPVDCPQETAPNGVSDQ